ncbi:MAG: PA0069 family radical SAM protein [Planctomycetota bacterium]
MRFGSQVDPPNRFEKLHVEADFEHLEDQCAETDPNNPRCQVEYLSDDSQSIVTENRSPDIPFRYSINPYRGCAHGCSYCYARVGHQYLGMSAGLDFETKIVVKEKAPELFRGFLAKRSWQPEPIVFSGVTDCYQPVERKFQLTRQCLKVALECRQPVSVITKNALVARDLDLLRQLAELELVHAYLSITTLDAELAREMEPRTSTPVARLRAIRELSEAGIPTGVMMAPIVPGLTDSEIPSLLDAASEAGARCANYIMLRLPQEVEPVFLEWLQRVRPTQADRVLDRVRQVRDGKLNDSTWGQRMSGSGVMATQIKDTFRVFCNRANLQRKLPRHRCDLFIAPHKDEASGQLKLF